MTGNEDLEKLRSLLQLAITSLLGTEAVRAKLNDAYNAAHRLSSKVTISNTDNMVLWVNAMLDRFLKGRVPRESDLQCYCKAMLEILSPEEEGVISQPRPKDCE